ncbi:DUF4164 family protein [Tepidicaulis sp.]|uniref:DUF4164 family protein n=1 Tax=Tepidicaulis sp. TaxID=1920809 RepID=UPI003B5CBBAB
MSKLDTAMDRFAGSVDRLEALLNRRMAQGRKVGGGGDAAGDLAGLRGDKARLEEELNVMKAEVRRLSTMNERASEDITSAVDGIRKILAAG